MNTRAILPALLMATLALPLTAALARSPARADPLTAQRAASQAPVDMAPQEIVSRANAALNGISALNADFVQTNPDGKRDSGRLYLARPGKLRFDYDPPSPLEIVADGQNVVLRNRRLKTSDTYPISQTPLDFLLRDSIDLGAMRLKGAVMTANGASVHIENDSSLIGTSKVTLLFDAKVENLVQWRVIDTQGRSTVVSLSNVNNQASTDSRMFDLRFQIPQR